MGDLVEKVGQAIDNTHLSIVWEHQKCWVMAGSFDVVVAGPFDNEIAAQTAASRYRGGAAALAVRDWFAENRSHLGEWHPLCGAIDAALDTAAPAEKAKAIVRAESAA